jgi:hypothetical protein
MSKDFQKLNNLRRSLAVYRMVFGQPRQEDLIQFLLKHYDEETVKRAVVELRMDFSPKANNPVKGIPYEMSNYNITYISLELL